MEYDGEKLQTLFKPCTLDLPKAVDYDGTTLTQGEMRMKNRIFSCLLALSLLCCALPSAMAAPAIPSEEEASQVLSALEIMVGDETGALHLERPVNRAEFVKMAVAATPGGSGIGSASISPYPDVPRGHWAAGYIQTAVECGLITGYLDGTFRPDNTITLAEGVTIVLRLLGWQNGDFSTAYPTGQMAKYRDLDLDRGVRAGQTDAMTRQDCLYLFYNLLTAPSRTTGTAYIYSLGHSLTPSGQVDRVALINAAMEGPVMISEGWTDKVTFLPSSARFVYRDGTLTDFSALRDNDIVYWSKSMRTLWAYSKTVTGTITAITPSTSPTSVTVAGMTYPLETASAAFRLSDLGSFKTGDTVTLLLGRSGGVAAVLPGGAASSTLYALVEAVAPGMYTDATGNTYTAKTLTLRLTDGSQRTFPYDGNLIEAEDLVQVLPSGKIERLSSPSLSGKVSTDGKKLGSLSFAQDVEILDTYKNFGFRVWPARLAGVQLDEHDILYYCLNGLGEISHLILRDVTGDGHEYGILLNKTEVEADMFLLSIYTYEVNGQVFTTDPLAKAFSASEGPSRFTYQNGELANISSLSSVRLDSVSGQTAREGGKTWLLAEDVAVYELHDDDYYLSSLSIVEKGSYHLTGYYDTTVLNGGRIRVLVAAPK